MGQSIIDFNADYSESGVGIIVPPVDEGLVELYRLKKSAPFARKNRAMDGVDGALVGSPVVTPTYVPLVGQSSWLQSRTGDLPDQTVYAVCRAKAVSPVPNLFGCATTGARAFVFVSGSAAIALSETRSDGAGGTERNNIDLPGANPLDWMLICAVFRQNAASTLINDTAGAKADGTATNQRALSAVPFTMCSSGSAYGGSIDAAFMARYNVAHSQDQIDKMLSYIRTEMLRDGITV